MHKPSIRVLAFLLLPTLGWGYWLLPDAQFAGLTVSDVCTHETFTRQLSHWLSIGQLGLDGWDDHCCMGAAVFRTYQNLPYYFAALLDFVTGRRFDVSPVRWLIFLSLTLQGIAFYYAARLLGHRRMASLGAAWLAPLVVSSSLKGHSFESYVVSGLGLFPQALAVPPFVITLAWFARITGWVRPYGRPSFKEGLTLGAWLAITFCLHHFLGYLAVLVGFVFYLGALPRKNFAFWGSSRCLATGAGVFLLIAGYQILSILQDGALMQHTIYYSKGRWDGYGAHQVLKWILDGTLLDEHRHRGLTFLLFTGILCAVLRKREAAQRAMFIAFGIGFALLSGRPTFGSWLDFIPGIQNLHLERAAILLQCSAVLLSIGVLAWISDELISLPKEAERRRWLAISGALAYALVVLSLIPDRVQSLERNLTQMASLRRDAYAIDPDLMRSIRAAASGYFWGGDHRDPYLLRSGDVPYYLIAEREGISQLSVATHNLTYVSDTIYLFNPGETSHYEIFNIASVLVRSEASHIPEFLKRTYFGPEGSLYSTPAIGWFGVIGIPRTTLVDGEKAYMDGIIEWLSGRDARKGLYPAIIPRKVAKRFPLAIPEISNPNLDAAWGKVESSNRLESGVYQATLLAERSDAFGVLRMAYHPRWEIRVNGASVAPKWVAPGLTAFALQPGKNEVTVRFLSDPWRARWFLVGMVTLVFLFAYLYAPPIVTPVIVGLAPARLRYYVGVLRRYSFGRLLKPVRSRR